MTRPVTRHALGVRLLILAAISLLPTLLWAQEAPVPEPSAVVSTTSGDVQGLVIDGIHTFKGLRYGAPPVGELRFKPPQKPERPDHLIDATDFGAPAMQMPSATSAVHTSDFGLVLKTVFPTPSEMKIDNEDSLFLNVWTPATADDEQRPVMVWFHGGGYAYGSGAWPMYDGENLARRGDVVVVTVNHRLNVFGYLELSDVLGDEYAGSGNAGMLDLVLSLEWVRDNIDAFGGDPDNVTIMGESGGGSKVSHLLAMPAADGLFHKAIIQSGPGLTSTPKEAATNTARTLLDKLGIDPERNSERLLTMPAEELLAAASSENLRFGPVLDGDALPRHPFTPDAPDISKDVPIIIGSNKDEMTIFQASAPWFGRLTDEQLQANAENMPQGAALLGALREIYPDYSPTHLMTALSSTRFTYGSQVLAERKAAQQGAPVYMYFLTWETPVNNGLFRSPHTLEIPLMFSNVDKTRALVGPGEEPEILADQMSSAWIAFARSGDPNTDAIPQWPAYDADDRATMMFDVESEVVNDPNSEIRKILSDAE